jgi:CheY-like chemotaxis protein
VSPPQDAGPRLVVVVEDSDTDFEAFERALLRVAPAASLLRFVSGRELFEHQLSIPALVVLMDLDLPGENGLRILHRLRGHPTWRPVPVVIYSGSGRPEDVAAAYTAGAAGYLVKPSDPHEIEPQARALWAWWAETVQPPFDLRAGTWPP